MHLGDKIDKKIHSSSAHTVEFASVAADNDRKKKTKTTCRQLKTHSKAHRKD